MYLTVEENPNCEALEGRVFQERTAAVRVTQVLRRRNHQEVWCWIIGINPGMKECPALARKVDDSGDGTCYLVSGGAWGLRMKEATSLDLWSLENPAQWGESFMLLPADGDDLRLVP